MPKILYLLDGHAIAYPAYFALTSGTSTRWATSSGEPTAGIYGFASMLLKLLEQEEPDYLAVSFDTGKTFRHEMYPNTKAHAPKCRMICARKLNASARWWTPLTFRDRGGKL